MKQGQIRHYMEGVGRDTESGQPLDRFVVVLSGDMLNIHSGIFPLCATVTPDWTASPFNVRLNEDFDHFAGTVRLLTTSPRQRVFLGREVALVSGRTMSKIFSGLATLFDLPGQHELGHLPD